MPTTDFPAGGPELTALVPAFDGEVGGLGSGTIFGDETGSRPLTKARRRQPAAVKRISSPTLRFQVNAAVEW